MIRIIFSRHLSLNAMFTLRICCSRPFFSSIMLKAMNEVLWWSRYWRKLSTVDGSCIPLTEVTLWTVNGSSLACYPSPLSESQINFDKAQKLTWKEVKFLYGTKENYKREYKREVSQSCSLHILLQSAMFCKYSLKIKGSTKIGCATPDTKNH